MAKLMCYSWNMFGRVLKENNWSDGNLPEDWVFIEIGEQEGNGYDDEPFWLHECDQVITFHFDDIAGYRVWDALPDIEWTPAQKEVHKDVYGMTDEDAARMFAFIDKNIGKNIMVHCSVGVSRSQGVVRFVLDNYPEWYSEKDTNPNNPCVIPNIHVVSLLKKQFDKKYN